MGGILKHREMNIEKKEKKALNIFSRILKYNYKLMVLCLISNLSNRVSLNIYFPAFQVKQRGEIIILGYLKLANMIRN